MEDFNWEQLAWTSPILVAVTAGLFALFKAVADRRVSPIDEMEKVLARYQALLETEERRSARAREREKEAFKTALEFRAYSTAWERWHAAGMPDPPGMPKRPENAIDGGDPHTAPTLIVP